MSDMVDLSPAHLAIVEGILSEHVPECEIRAFGSRAKWTARDNSDLDLVVVGDGPLDKSVLGRLREAFEESNLPMRVDVLDWHIIADSFRNVIEQEYVVLQDGHGARAKAGWREVTLGDALTLQRGFDLPMPKRILGPYPVIASTGPVGSHNSAKVQGPGVVIGRSGSLGGGQFIRSAFWPLNTTLWVKDFKGNDRRFCYYLLKSLDLARFNAGSGVPTLNRNHIHPLPITLPPLPEQRGIAHVLGTLDDKIELNRRMNETLEAMARALFKCWFVDFEPVRAKMEGRWRRGESLPGLPAELYDAFPERLTPSELGEIPEGWEVRRLGELFTTKNVRLGDSNVPEYSCTNSGLIPRSQRFKKKLSVSNSKNKVIRKGDFVFGLSRRILNFGMMQDDVGCVSPAYRTYSTNTELVIPDILERIMRLRSEYFYLAVSSSSREGQSTSQDSLYALMVSMPNIKVQRRLYSIANEYTLRSLRLQQESHTIAELRDTLLPKLVSGEVRV